MIYSVQMLRFVAALLVVLFHSVSTLDGRLGSDWSELRYLAGFGASGVHIFFVISGFIMVYTSRDAFGDWRFPALFLRRRVVRIYPVYVVLALINVPISLLIDLPIPETAWDFLRTLALWPGASSDLIFVGWTLSYEMFFYVVFAGLVLLPRNGAVLGLTVLFVGLIIMGRQTGFGTTGLSYLATSALLLEFVLGAWIGWCAIKFPDLPGWVGIGAAALGLAGFAASIAWGYNRAPLVILWGVPSGFLIFGLIYMDAISWLKGLFRRFSLLGEASYSLYLIHAIVIPTLVALLMEDVELTAGVLIVWCASVTALSIFVSIIFCIYVERPMTRALNRAFRKETRYQSPPAAAPR